MTTMIEIAVLILTPLALLAAWMYHNLHVKALRHRAEIAECFERRIR